MANRIGAALIGGAAGALTLTVLHQVLKRITPDAPRADNLAKQGIRKAFRAAGNAPPSDDELHWASLAGDLAANTVYYGASLAFGPKVATWLGPLMGAGAGVGALALPGPMGLNPDETNRTPTTQALAFGLYLAGSLAATATYHALLDEHDANSLLADIPA